MWRWRVAFRWLCVGVFLAGGIGCARRAGVGSPAGETPAAGVPLRAARTLADQLEELRERVDAVRETRDRLRAEIKESPELAALREALTGAEAAYQDRQKTDATYAAAVKAEDDARAALQKLVQQKIEADDEARRIGRAKPESKEAQKEARDKLQEIRRRIESDNPDVRAAREGLEAASKARREAYDSEALATLRAARDAARAAFEAKLKDLEETNAELAAAVKEREELRARVAELEKQVGEQPDAGKDTGGRKRGVAAGPYLIGLGLDGATVSWETWEAAPGQVEYYTRPSRRQTLRSEAPSRFHRVRITGLPPATECWYRVQAGSELTPFARFRTAPDGPAPFRFADLDGDTLVVTAYGEAGEAFDKVVLKKHGGRREFGETVPAAALEFLQAAKRFATFTFPHARSGIHKREFAFTVTNPYADEMRGELSWDIPSRAWSVSPPSQIIRVAPSRSERVTFTAELTPPADGSTVEPVPRAILAAGGRTVTTKAFAIERPPRPKAALPHSPADLACAPVGGCGPDP